jgi:TatD DNase family protein
MLIDAHAHLDRYDTSIEAILSEIELHQILTISNSMCPADYSRNLEIARSSKLVVPTFGVHPWEAPKYVDLLDDLAKEISASPMIGECGLDYFFVKDQSQYAAQRQVFEYLLRAAVDQDKVVTIHTKGAERDVLELLDSSHIRRAIVHWYSGPLKLVERFLSQGCYFTVGVEVLRSEEIRALARKLPLERLLTETDSPGGYHWLTGVAGTPSVLLQVIATLADIRGTTPDRIIQQVESNFRTLAEGDLVNLS